MSTPVTKKEVVSEEYCGYTISDPFRWLESPESEETKQWIDAQNEYAEASLRDDRFQLFSDELAKNFKTTTFSLPRIVKGRKKYFYTERLPDQDQPVLLLRHGLHGDPVVLIDPNGMNQENTVSLDFWAPSRNGKYLAYGLSRNGTEMATLYIKDVDSGEDLSDVIENCRYSAVRWLPDDSGFFYTRNPRPDTVSQGEKHLHTKVYFHRLSDDSAHDELIFGKDRPKDDMIGLSTSIDGRFLLINVSQNWVKNDLYVYDVATKILSPLVLGLDAKFSITLATDTAFILTNYQANNFKVLSVSLLDLFTPVDQWTTCIPEREYVLDDIAITQDKIIATYLVNACSRADLFDHKGNALGQLPLPECVTIGAIATHREEREFFYSITSFTFPSIGYRFDPEQGNYVEHRRCENPINPDDYMVAQEWFRSKDGTKIPVFIVYKKGLEKTGINPTILYGYGGFGNSETPAFNRGFIPWFERGGVFAVANIRGGGEFGDDWHKSAIKDRKQNSYDDFIAAAQYLIDAKYTRSEHLGILGGSNGGLLVSAVAIQRPDLFKAVCSRVPLTDMVRFPLFGMAIRWINEYGNPEIKEELEQILTWSPYHNVHEDKEYPNFLFTTGVKDSRVDPLHARKMAAILQSVNKAHDVFIVTEMNAGHGAGKPISKIVESQAYVLSFFAKYLGLMM